MTAYVILGKIGDVLSVLPLLQHYSECNKAPATLVISEQYAHVVEGLDYINPVIWKGHWQNLSGAVMWAKERYDKVVVPQTYGSSVAIEHKTASFQLDQWLRAGGLKLWDKLPLTINRRDDAKEFAKSHLGEGPTILVADQGESSKFGHSDRLVSLLNQLFYGTHRVVALSGIRLELFTDFVCLYDAADLVIVTETAHLHLAKATKTPVIALAADKPQRWHGSAWSKSHLLHIRYSQYEQREDEIMEAVSRVLKKEKSQPLEFFGTAMDFGYNPSITIHDGIELVSYRHHPDPKAWKTKIVLQQRLDGFTSERPLVLPGIYGQMSNEDARFFTFKGRTFVSLTVAVFPGTAGLTVPCAIIYGELKQTATRWHLEDVKMVKYGRNNFAGQEKNWVFFDYEDRLHFIYQCSPEQVVCRLDKDGVTVDKVYRTKSPSWSHGEIRGGTQPFDYPRSGGHGTWLRFFHSLNKITQYRENWTYSIGALLMDDKPPFQIRKISKTPIFSGDERYVHGHKFWKPSVAIPYGAVPVVGGWKVSIGINDSLCAILTLNEKDLKL